MHIWVLETNHAMHWISPQKWLITHDNSMLDAPKRFGGIVSNCYFLYNLSLNFLKGCFLWLLLFFNNYLLGACRQKGMGIRVFVCPGRYTSSWTGEKWAGSWNWSQHEYLWFFSSFFPHDHFLQLSKEGQMY